MLVRLVSLKSRGSNYAMHKIMHQQICSVTHGKYLLGLEKSICASVTMRPSLLEMKALGKATGLMIFI